MAAVAQPAYYKALQEEAAKARERLIESSIKTWGEVEGPKRIELMIQRLRKNNLDD